jgi:signal transduction histidine kinase
MADFLSSDTKAAIVIIDDDGCLIKRISLILLQNGYRVHAATCAQQGLQLIADKEPELVLLDFHLPGADVPALLQEIRSRFPSTCVAISSGKRAGKKAAELIKAGAAGCFFKPFNSLDLISRLDNLLRIRELELSNKKLQFEHDQLLIQLEACHQGYPQLLKEKTESLRKANSEIAQTEKLAALGYLAADMAHDIRNPLNSISLFTQLMRQNVTDADRMDFLNKIIREVEKIDSIIRTLLDGARRTRNPSTNVRIDQLIDAALEIFAPQIETSKIQLERRYHVIPPPIKADPGELVQIFTNLFLNALDEMPGGGCLGVSISVEKGMVVVRVEDSGRGISDKVLPNIFDPFFTTKSHGTGLGLPVVKRITRMYGGSITVEKSTQDGTVLRVEFPACTEADQTTSELRASGSS